MSLMEWYPGLSVGVAQFDEEHKRLVKLLNELHDSMLKGRGRETLGKTLDSLIAYTRSHFANEERLMKQHGFPGYAGHKAEHDALAKQVLAVQAKQQSGDGGAALTMDVFKFLKDWLTKHIMGSDCSYTAFMNARGVK